MSAVRAVGVVLGLALVGCKPATPEEAFRKALRWTDVAAVQKQIDGGQDVGQTFADGNQPIHVVAESMHGSGEMMRVLLDKGATVDAKNGDGLTAWDLRWGDGRRNISEDGAAILLALLDHGFEPPKKEFEDGRTLLHEAARRCHSTRLVSVLVAKHGFEVDAKDEHGWTPLHIAVNENNAEAATGLLEKDADPNAKTTETVGSSHDRAGTKIWQWRYDKGSHPLDVYSHTNHSRFETDVRKVLEQYGGTRNPNVDNKPE